MNTPNRDSNIFTDYTLEQTRTHTASKTFMANVFAWMFGALLVSAASAYFFAAIPGLDSLLREQTPKGTRMTILGWVVMFAPLGFVILMSARFQKMSLPSLSISFILFAAILGASLSSIFLRYSAVSIMGCFVSAAAMFGVMAVMGYTTNKDLTKFGSLLTMGLIGLIIASVVNVFLHSSGFQFIISFFGIAIFTGLTAYDVQKLKRIGAGLEYEDVAAADIKKLSIMGALSLYLDFINIFIYLLQMFGRSRD